MNVRDLLPIGSVVLLKNAEKRLLIFGVKQVSVDDQDKEYDYIGVLYPEGYLGGEYQFLFDHDDIASVAFTGYQDEEREQFIENLVEHYESLG